LRLGGRAETRSEPFAYDGMRPGEMIFWNPHEGILACRDELSMPRMRELAALAWRKNSPQFVDVNRLRSRIFRDRRQSESRPF
jgi:hypothetical protein